MFSYIYSSLVNLSSKFFSQIPRGKVTVVNVVVVEVDAVEVVLTIVNLDVVIRSIVAVLVRDHVPNPSLAHDPIRISQTKRPKLELPM